MTSMKLQERKIHSCQKPVQPIFDVFGRVWQQRTLLFKFTMLVNAPFSWQRFPGIIDLTHEDSVEDDTDPNSSRMSLDYLREDSNDNQNTSIDSEFSRRKWILTLYRHLGSTYAREMNQTLWI
ncbi:hypothetical protein JCM33374_g4624 [Metschnikowia sp. JCM 33374]|nr:hypothetical protein JCM33374_g4624 [Metschnikowia sp. JCM 33374]